jgi:hypothetical protein
MKRITAIALALALAGCAQGSGAPTPEEGPQRAQVAWDAGSFELMDLTVEDNTVSGWLDVPPEQLWPHVPPVYDEIGLKLSDLETYDPGRHRVAVVNHRARRLAGKRLSRLLRCGDSFGPPKADNGQVRVSLSTWLEPAEGGTRMHTRLEAWTRGVGTSTGAIQCSSTSALEQDIMKRIQLRYLKSRE